MRNTVVAFASLLLTVGAHAQEFDRRADMVGGDPDRGRCSVVVVVDGAAEIRIRRAEARLIDLRGAPATWRRFECTSPLPADPMDFGFRPVGGRGRQELIQPARDGAPAVIRIEDPQSGAGEYRFDLFWRGGGGDYRRDDDFRRDGDRRDGDRREGDYRPWVTDDAIRSCQEAVRREAMDRFRTDRIEIRRIRMEDAPDRREWVTGFLEVHWGPDRMEPYRFGCSVDFGERRIRSVNIDRVDRDRYDRDWRR